jgi:hypothetical protein
MGKRTPGIPVGIDTGGKVTVDRPSPCEWCGEPVEQPATGRRRLYCRRTCRELAYRERKTRARIEDAVAQAVAAVSSTDVTPDPVASVDETRVPEPRRGPWKGSRRVAQGFREALSREP